MNTDNDNADAERRKLHKKRKRETSAEWTAWLNKQNERDRMKSESKKKQNQRVEPGFSITIHKAQGQMLTSVILKDPSFWEYFVQDAEGFLTENINKHLRMVNGTYLHSLPFLGPLQ